MNLTSVLVVINDQTTDVSNVKDNLKYAGSKTQLFVFNNHCKDQRLITELQSITTTWVENQTPFIKTFSECVNELLRISSGDFICVAREDALYCENWLLRLIESCNLIENTGIISLNDFSTSEGTYQLTKDNNLEWVYTKDFRINNFAFFRRDLIFKIGGFNENINGVYAFWDLCDRARQMGFLNYFVPNTTMIKLSVYTDDLPEPTPEQFNKRKIIQFFKIFNLTQKDLKNIQTLTENFGDIFYFQENMGCIIFSKKNEMDFDIIAKLCSNFLNLNLNMVLYSSSYFQNDVLKQTFIGVIKPRQ